MHFCISLVLDKRLDHYQVVNINLPGTTVKFQTREGNFIYLFLYNYRGVNGPCSFLLFGWVKFNLLPSQILGSRVPLHSQKIKTREDLEGF